MNTSTYRHFFGLTKEPFPNEIDIPNIYQTNDLIGTAQRFEYAVNIGAMALVTGDIGAGKSTALKYAAAKLHPSEYRVIHIIASAGSILEFYRMALEKLGVETASASRAFLLRNLKRELLELIHGKNLKPVFIVDEASLMKLEVFAELHVIALFDQGEKAKLPVILAGQNNLIDKLKYRSSRPLASRIAARSHLEGADRKEMEQYLSHHLKIAGLNQNPFEDNAITAIHQGAGGLFRKANHLARGALIAAAAQNQTIVNAEHVRLASTEIF